MSPRQLGQNGPEISTMGYGLMSLSHIYGPSEDEEALHAIHTAIDCGIDFLDTAEAYGFGHNEGLLGKVLETRRPEVVVATKTGLEIRDGALRANGRPENIRRAIESSLEKLGTDHVDLYYLHRLDPDVPIEESVGAMARLVDEGKVRQLGLSAIQPETLRRAHAEHPIAALQSEYSLFQRDPEAGVLETCRELGTTFVAYSPLGRGMLTGAIRGAEDLEDNDMRRQSPQLAPGNVEQNLDLIDALTAVAREQDLEPGQLALAWLLAQDVVPLFGTRRAERIRSNRDAAEVALDAAILARIDEIAPAGAVAGLGVPAAMDQLREK